VRSTVFPAGNAEAPQNRNLNQLPEYHGRVMGSLYVQPGASPLGSTTMSDGLSFPCRFGTLQCPCAYDSRLTAQTAFHGDPPLLPPTTFWRWFEINDHDARVVCSKSEFIRFSFLPATPLTVPQFIAVRHFRRLLCSRGLCCDGFNLWFTRINETYVNCGL
jgi:hypothetical protein